jgi:ABC-type transport system substrate-binding protein/TolA-binding protein
MPSPRQAIDATRPIARLAFALAWATGCLVSSAVAQDGTVPQPAATAKTTDAITTGEDATAANTTVPLYEQPPRDWLLLRNDPPEAKSSPDGVEDDSTEPAPREDSQPTERPKQVEIYVLPIALTGPDAIDPGQPRRLPENPPSGRSFNVRLADRPQEEFQVYWRDVLDIRLFEQRLIDEAERLVAAGRFDEAFGYYQFLDTNYPNFAGVQDSLQSYLFGEAGSLFADKQVERAALLLIELHERNPDHPKVSRALGVAIDALIQQRNADEQYAECREYLDRLTSRYPDHSVAARWQLQWEQAAADSVRKAEAEEKAGRLREAHESIRRAQDIWPAVAGVAELTARLAEKYHYVAVGVTEVTTSAAPARPTVSWTARRRSRLVTRKLVELAAYRPDGAAYESPFGEFEATDLGLGLRFNIGRGIEWQPQGTLLTASDVSRHLLAMSDANSDAYNPLWADLFEGVSVSTANSLSVQLARSYVRPQAVLQTPLIPWNLWRAPDDEAPSLGGYLPLPLEDDGTHFIERQGYFAAEEGQPSEIHQRTYTSTADAAVALRQGKIAVIDRVAPWEVARLRAQKGVSVTAYAVPTVHCLIPGQASELTQSRVFRRAILYGIDRQQILDKWLLRGEQIPGCRVVTGPFPTGYAYDEEIEPRGFKPQLGMTLAWTAWRGIMEAQKKAQADGEGDEIGDSDEGDDSAQDPNPHSDDQPATFPELTLAHPADEIATRACQQIQQYLRALGIPVRLVPVDPADEWDLAAYDLVYAELFVSEPAVDASTLFGPGGLIDGNSAFLDQFVRGVELATDSRTARTQLFDIHRRVYEDLPIIPLWQLTEHFASADRLEGVGTPASSLYDHVEQWRVQPWQPGGTP